MKTAGYSLVHTDDGSCSLYCEEYRELMHSASGAYEESVLKHVYPSKVLEKDRDARVLDIGCGMGYNILALLTESRRRHYRGFITVVSLEKDAGFRDMLDPIRFKDDRDDIYGIIKRAMDAGEAGNAEFSLRVERGDARDLVPGFEEGMFDAVFHDPFSPAKNPELWTVEFFKVVHRAMGPDAVLTTYSSALHIRRALLDAGFQIGKGPPVGKKREGTLAAKSEIIPLLDEKRIDDIFTEPNGIPYRDWFMNGSRDEIRERRLREMRVKRGLQAR
ncbi:MAG TPA: hypothetical protein ENN21_09045 [Spirochaetes bacterium]|nr:hypothetical protein [Spirochaetota bacterium]